MKIGKYFTLQELTKTSSVLFNSPGDVELDNINYLVKNLLDPLREMLGEPIIINSCYRSVQVNKYVKGASTSQHVKGEAADIVCSNNSKLFNLIKDNFEYDQLIWERGDNKQPSWVHVSLTKTVNRKEILKFDGKKYVKLN